MFLLYIELYKIQKSNSISGWTTQFFGCCPFIIRIKLYIKRFYFQFFKHLYIIIEVL